jgi:hypothetical protein
LTLLLDKRPKALFTANIAIFKGKNPDIEILPTREYFWVTPTITFCGQAADVYVMPAKFR